MLETKSKLVKFHFLRFFHFDEWNDHIGSQFWEFKRNEANMKWRMQWKEKKEMERVEEEKRERDVVRRHNEDDGENDEEDEVCRFLTRGTIQVPLERSGSIPHLRSKSYLVYIYHKT